MGFFSFGRIVGAFFNQLFRWLFWNKSGQKILFVIVIAVILVAFFKLGEVAAVEPDNFANYDEISFDGTLSGFLLSSVGKIQSTESVNSVVYYIELNPFNYYSFYDNNTASSRSFRYGFTDSLDTGSNVFNFTNVSIASGDTGETTFSGNNGHKYFVVFVNAANPDIKLYYNAYPFEISSRLVYDNWQLSGNYINWNNSSVTSKLTLVPVSKGVSYRFHYSEVIPSNSVDSLCFVDNTRWIESFNNSSSSTFWVASVSPVAGLDTIDIVAPADGFICVPLANYLVSVYSSTLYISLDTDTTNTAVNQSTNAINNVNDSLTNPNISEEDSDYDLPESGVTDIAESGFANIFDKLRTAFTSESSGQGLVVQVPFTDKSFTISKNTVFGNAQLGIVGTLINSFWYFLVSLWIVKDIAHKMNMIKSGNIELAQTSNIKEDLL